MNSCCRPRDKLTAVSCPGHCRPRPTFEIVGHVLANREGMWLMTEARWRLVVDQDGVTIAGDRFQLTTAPRQFAVDDAVFGVTESAEMEAIVAELDSMTRRTYGQ